MIGEKLEKKTEESIKKILDEGITTNNLEHLYKLTKINHIAKEDENMNYGNYGNYGREQYGEYDGYGARRRDSRGRYMEGGYGRRYRGHDHLDRMYDEYGRYSESRERYGAGSQEGEKSFMYMVKALEDFIMVLNEEAETEQQRMQLRQVLQNSMR